ncbi:MAG: hypothetical protein AAB434_08545 [Planctomycetota bacterium]
MLRRSKEDTMRKGKNLGWRPAVAMRVGEEAFKLASDHRAELESRLSAGLIDGLGADVALLRGTTVGAAAASAEKRSATLTQGEAAHRGRDLVVAIRSVVRGAEPDDKAFQKAFGVGEAAVTRKILSVDSALEMILRAAETYPERTRALGILPEDLDEVRRVRGALHAAGDTQGAKVLSAKVATTLRYEAQARVQAAVRRLVGAAPLAFRGQPQVARLFRDLIPGHKAATEEGTTIAPRPQEGSTRASVA